MPPAQAAAARTNVLYVAIDGRETRLVAGAFDYAQPNLHLDLVSDLNEARARLREPGRYDALVVGWSVAEHDGVALLAHVREHSYPLALVAAGEQSLDRYREAGADRCVQKGGSFLSRLAIAIDEAITTRQTAVPVPAATSPLKIAYAGDVDRITADLGAAAAALRIEPLPQALKNADVRPRGVSLDVDVFLIDHGAPDGRCASALNDVRARSLDAPVVMLVDPADEPAAHQNFGSMVDDYLTKTPAWASRLSLRLGLIVARHAQLRELATLRVKEARLRSMVDRLPASVVRLSAEGGILATNAVAAAMLGVQGSGALVRKPFDALVAPEDRTTWTEFFTRVCAGEQRSVEMSVTTLAGTSRIMEAAATPVPAELGRAMSVLMVLRDVTDRKRLEAAVEAAVGSTPPTSEAPAAGPSGPAQDATLPREWESDLHRAATHARAALHDLGSVLEDVQARHDAALTRQIDGYATLKASQREHWRSYEAFFQNAHHGMFRAACDATLVAANAAFTRILGYGTAEDLIAAAQSIDDVVSSEPWRQAIEGWRNGSASEAVELSWRRKDRSLATLRLHGRTVGTPDDTEEYLEVTAEDVTAQRALEQQLRRARRWEDAARVTSGIAADLAHVLAALQDPGDRATHPAADDDRVAAHTAKALTLSRQLVAFGRREARDPSALDVNAVVREMEAVVRRLLDEHIELAFNLAHDLATVHAAQPVVEEALVNLAVAARDVLPAGGRIAIATTPAEVTHGDARDHGVMPGAYAMVSLTATGWGMDGALHERLSSAGAPVTDDAGRRLSVASRAVSHAGGGLRVYGVAEESLTFEVYLPLTGGAAAPDDETPVPLESL